MGEIQKAGLVERRKENQRIVGPGQCGQIYNHSVRVEESGPIAWRHTLATLRLLPSSLLKYG